MIATWALGSRISDGFAAFCSHLNQPASDKQNELEKLNLLNDHAIHFTTTVKMVVKLGTVTLNDSIAY